MVWENQSVFQYNLMEFPTNCTLPPYSQSILHFLLIPIHYVICINGIIQNILFLQTLIYAHFREKWTNVYKFLCSINGLIISICLIININLNKNYFLWINIFCIILNSILYWISSIHAFQRMLMQLFFFKLYGSMTSQHSLIISIFIYLFVIITYILSLFYSQISLFIFLLHLILPCIIHILSLCITLISIIQRKIYLSEYSMDMSSYFQILTDQKGFCVAPLCMIICLIAAILSIQYCILVVFYLMFFLPSMISFSIYILPSKTNMKKFQRETPCGKFLMKFHC